MIPTHDQQAHKAWYWAIRPPEAQGVRVHDSDVLDVLEAAQLDVDPRDVLVTAFRERRWALLSARADREVFGHPTLAVLPVGGWGWCTVLDLRPALARMLEGERERARATLLGEVPARAVD